LQILWIFSKKVIFHSYYKFRMFFYKLFILKNEYAAINLTLLAAKMSFKLKKKYIYIYFLRYNKLKIVWDQFDVYSVLLTGDVRSKG